MHNNLKKLRQQAGLSLRVLSQITNIPYRTLQDFENEKITQTSYENLFLLADTLACRIEDIIVLPVYTIAHHQLTCHDIIWRSESRKLSVMKYIELYATKQQTTSCDYYILYKDDKEMASFKVEKISDEIVVTHSYTSEFISFDPVAKNNKCKKK